MSSLESSFDLQKSFFFFFSIFFLYFFFPGEQAGCDTKSVHVFVCVYTGSSIQAEAPTNTHDLQHLHFHESIGPTQQIQNSVIQGKNVTEVHFRSIFSLASQLPSCLHIYTNLALDKLSMILLLRNVMLCLLCMMCWRLLGTNLLLVYSSLCIYKWFLGALIKKRSSPAGKMQVLLGKGKNILLLQQLEIVYMWLPCGALNIEFFYSFYAHNGGALASSLS